MTTEKLSGIMPSATVKLNDMLVRLAREGKDIISFSVGEPDFPTPENIKNAAKKALDDGFTHYTPSNGILDLRRAITRKLKNDNNIVFKPSNVIVTPTKFAIYSTINALTEYGDKVLVPDPAWVTYIPAIKLAESKPVSYNLLNEEDFRIDEEDLKLKVEQSHNSLKLLIINTPGNPTGHVMSIDELKFIRDLAVDNNFTVLSDEVYEKLVYDGKHISIGSLDGMEDRTVTVNGFSKAYAMTGWRLGWLAADEEYIKDIIKLQQHSLTCASSFSQVAGIEALEGDQSSLEAMKREFRSRRDLMYSMMKEIPGLNPHKPMGAFYIFPDYDFDISSEALSKYILEKGLVGVTPGESFGRNGEKNLRFSYATSRENIVKGMESIAKVLEELR